MQIDLIDMIREVEQESKLTIRMKEATPRLSHMGMIRCQCCGKLGSDQDDACHGCGSELNDSPRIDQVKVARE